MPAVVPSPVPGKPIVIMRTGTFVDVFGTEVTFTERDLAAAADAYNGGTARAPMVVGHPANDLPSYGTIGSLSVGPAGDRLLAHPSTVSSALRELVASNRYRKVSASFWPPTSPRNPAGKAFYLKHLGFLGASAPAVKGLGVVSFGETTDVETFVIERDGQIAGRARFLAAMLPALPADRALEFCEREATVMALPYDCDRHRQLGATLRRWREEYGARK